MYVVILFGAPGSGKGTQADLLQSNFEFRKISTGDMLRQEIASSSNLGLELSHIVKSGQLVSDEIVIELIKNYFKEQNKIGFAKGYIFDGFPRNKIQAILLDKIISENNIDISNVKPIEIKVEDDILIDRIAGRFTCQKCKASYHKKFNNTKVEGICDYCGSNKFVVREDDNPSVLANRLEVYRKETIPVINYYKEQGNFFHIDGTKKIEEIFSEISDILGNA